jgi:hypothetical protein
MNSSRLPLVKESTLPELLREYATAIDKDRGHDKSAVTWHMRDAAQEIERLRVALRKVEIKASVNVAGSTFDQIATIAREVLGA